MLAALFPLFCPATVCSFPCGSMPFAVRSIVAGSGSPATERFRRSAIEMSGRQRVVFVSASVRSRRIPFFSIHSRPFPMLRMRPFSSCFAPLFPPPPVVVDRVFVSSNPLAPRLAPPVRRLPRRAPLSLTRSRPSPFCFHASLFCVLLLFLSFSPRSHPLLCPFGRLLVA